MARFGYGGVEPLQLSLAELAEIPDEVVCEMLEAGSKVAIKAMQRELELLGLTTRQKRLLNSIQAFQKIGRDKWTGEKKRYYLVYPYGPHHKYHQKLKVKEYKRSKHGRTYTVGGKDKTATANDVGFVLEFGAPKRNIKPKQWMRRALRKAEEQIVAAEYEVYDRHLKSKDL